MLAGVFSRLIQFQNSVSSSLPYTKDPHPDISTIKSANACGLIVQTLNAGPMTVVSGFELTLNFAT
jgi:hypothetical protein